MPCSNVVLISELIKVVLLSSNSDWLLSRVVVDDEAIKLLVLVCMMILVYVNHCRLENCIVVSPFIKIGPNRKWTRSWTGTPINVVSECGHWHQFPCSIYIWCETIVSQKEVHPSLHGLMVLSSGKNTSWTNLEESTLASRVKIQNCMKESERPDIVVISIQINSTIKVDNHWLNEVDGKEFVKD